MRKFEVLKTGLPSTYELKCPVCGTMDDVDTFVIQFCRCKMCRSDLVVIDSDEEKEEA